MTNNSSAVYTITINNFKVVTTPGDGFVDNLKIEDYYTSLKTTPSGLTYALCKAKRRGNLRYRAIIDKMNMVANVDIDTASLLTAPSDATAKTEATAFTFNVFVRSGDASLLTEDEFTPGLILTSTDCLARCVARAMTVDFANCNIDVFDPTSAVTVGTPGSTTSVPRYGSRIDHTFHFGAYTSDPRDMDGHITVVQIDPTMFSF
jgi:hypothetical protein